MGVMLTWVNTLVERVKTMVLKKEKITGFLTEHVIVSIGSSTGKFTLFISLIFYIEEGVSQKKKDC